MAKQTNNYKVVIEGNIGCGKSTLLSQFENVSNVQVLTEPVTKWQNLSGCNLLKSLYEDPKRWAFQFQSYVQLTRLQLWLDIDQKPFTERVIRMSLLRNSIC